MSATTQYITTRQASAVVKAMQALGYTVKRADVAQRYVINIVADFAGGDINEQVALTRAILAAL